MSHAAQRTAFVFAGSGSLGAVQVGMLRELMHAGVSADLVVGSSVGAMNAAYFAGAPNAAGVDKRKKFGADCGDMTCFLSRFEACLDSWVARII